MRENEQWCAHDIFPQAHHVKVILQNYHINHKIVECLLFNLDGKTRDADEFPVHLIPVFYHRPKHKVYCWNFAAHFQNPVPARGKWAQKWCWCEKCRSEKSARISVVLLCAVAMKMMGPTPTKSYHSLETE